MSFGNLASRIRKAEAQASPPKGRFFPEYRANPAGFAKDILKVTWTPAQVAVAESLLEPPYRTLVKASHNVGKTHLAAGVSLWWHLTRWPSIVITTAPKLEQVRDLTWKEIRRQGTGLVRFPGPKAVRIDRGPDDYATGTTAQSDTAFQGHHGPSLLFVFDEAVGVEPEFWRVTDTMFSPPGHAWLCIFNPTDSSSYAYQAEHLRSTDGKPPWRTIEMSALDHPNIAAELADQPPPVPYAIRLGRLQDLLDEWCEPVTGEPLSTDIEWPPASGKFLRPGPLAEARLLGRWPSQSNGVWSDSLWQATQALGPEWNPNWKVVVGCDVARFGDDYTTIHVRAGPVSVHHEAHNGWDAAQIVGRLKELCRQFVELVNECYDAHREPLKPEEITVHVDEDGIGGAGVCDHADGYRFVGLSAASVARDPEGYPNKRSELWFNAAARARRKQLFLGRLDQRSLDRLRQQLMAPTYKLDAAGRRVVEPKDVTKENLGRSPDDADGLNLAYWEPGPSTITAVEPDPAPDEDSWDYGGESRGTGMYGR